MDKPDTSNQAYVVGYEHTDVKLVPLVMSFGGLVGLFVGASAAMMWFLNFTMPKYTSDSNVPSWSVERKLPAHPQLQANPKEEMNLFKEAESPYVTRIESAIGVVAKQGISGVAGDEPKSAFKTGYPGSRTGNTGRSEATNTHPSAETNPEGQQGH